MIKIFAIIIAVLIFFISIPLKAFPAESAYKIISTVSEGSLSRRERYIYRSAGNENSQQIEWQNLPKKIWVPFLLDVSKDSWKAVAIMDGNLPPIPSKIQISKYKTIPFLNRKAILYEFNIKGNLSKEGLPDADLERLADIGVRSVEIEGEGLLIFDESKTFPVAGRLQMTRKIVPELWLQDAGKKNFSSKIETAWAAIP